jgi:hypothetical protein
MMQGPAPICLTCKHWNADDGEGFTCAAFPDGIPEPIYLTTVVHTEPYEGDNGILYEPVDADKDAQP